MNELVQQSRPKFMILGVVEGIAFGTFTLTVGFRRWRFDGVLGVYLVYEGLKYVSLGSASGAGPGML